MLDVFISSLAPQSGKTLVATGLAATMQSLAYTTLIYKPILLTTTSINGFKSDSEISTIKNIDSHIQVKTDYILSGKSSPFVEAYSNGIKLDIDTLINNYSYLSKNSDCKIIEGSNSITTPIAEKFIELDLVNRMNIPLVLVINPKRTSIDTSMAVISYIKQVPNIKFVGVIFNQHDDESDDMETKYYSQILKSFTNIEILGSLPDYKESLPTPDILISDVLNSINLEKVFGIKIEKLVD